MPLTLTVLPLPACLLMKVLDAALTVSWSPLTRLSPSVTPALAKPSYTLLIPVAVTVSARGVTVRVLPEAKLML